MAGRARDSYVVVMGDRGVVLVTGASSGIGWSAAEILAEKGWTVVGTSRREGAAGPAGVRMVVLDVTDGASVRACVRAVGDVDVLVSNAGSIAFGPIEEVAEADARRVFETNFWGAVRMVESVLPAMRARRRGKIVLVGSVAAHVAIPMNGFYAATKAALARWAEALRHETMHLGVDVTLVEPSDTRTRFWENARMVEPSIADYAPLREGVMGVVRGLMKDADDAPRVGRAIAEAASSERPPATIRVGGAARRVPRMRAWMPAAAFEAGVRRRFGLARLARGATK